MVAVGCQLSGSEGGSRFFFCLFVQWSTEPASGVWGSDMCTEKLGTIFYLLYRHGGFGRGCGVTLNLSSNDFRAKGLGEGKSQNL